MSVAVRTTLIQRVEQIRARLSEEYRKTPHFHGQGRRPEFIAGVMDLLVRLIGKLHHRAAIATFPLDYRAIHKMWSDLPEHLIRRAITVFQTLGLVTRVSELARRGTRSKSINRNATPAWYAPSQFRFTDRFLALLGVTDLPLENLTDPDVTQNVKEELEGGNTNNNAPSEECIRVGYGLTSEDIAALPERDRNALRFHLKMDEEWRNRWRDDHPGNEIPPYPDRRVIKRLAYKARVWATEGHEFRQGVAELKAFVRGERPPQPIYRVVSKAQVTADGFKMPKAAVPENHEYREEKMLRQAESIRAGDLDPFPIWGIHPGMTEDASRALHREEARMTIEDIHRRRAKRANEKDPDYH